MKTLILAALLSASAIAAHANIVVVPSAEGCRQAVKDKNAEVIALCDKIAKEKAEASKVTGTAKK